MGRGISDKISVPFYALQATRARIIGIREYFAAVLHYLEGSWPENMPRPSTRFDR